MIRQSTSPEFIHYFNFSEDRKLRAPFVIQIEFEADLGKGRRASEVISELKTALVVATRRFFLDYLKENIRNRYAGEG